MTNQTHRAGSSDSLLGLQLDEYRLEELLGQGGMARVYRALDVKLMRYAAIKVIDAPYRRDAEYIKRFEREAQAIAKLEHPNVVRLYRYGEVALGDANDNAASAQAPLLYMAMQYVQGKDLGYVLDSCRLDGEYVDAEEGLQVIQQVCLALDYVHAQGIIHRDVKPSNIMLSRDDGHAVLTDFGLALMTQLGTRGETFGSPHYIAPEQAVSSAKAVAQSDLYALGVILFEMFTGVLPFNAPDPLDIALLHMSVPPPNPREIRPELSEDLEKVILRAMEKKPEDRYQTGKALAEALERALHHKVETARASQKSVLDRVSIGFAANPLPPIPAAVTPGAARPQFAAEVPGLDEAVTELEAPAASAPPAAVTAEAEPAPEPEVEPIQPPVAQPSAREIPPTIRLFDPEPAAAQQSSPTPPSPEKTARSTSARLPGNAQPPAFTAQSVAAETLPPIPKPSASYRRWVWIGGGILAFVLLGFVCVAGIAGLIFSRLASPPPVPTLVSGAGSEVVATETAPASTDPTTAADPQGTPTKKATPAPTQTAAGPKTYTIQVGLCEDEGCLVVKNTGKYPLALSDLRLGNKNGAIQGSEWGVELLLPGKCVRAVKDENWFDRRPNGVSCDVTGYNLTREGKERFWKDTFTVEYAGQKIGDCRKGANTCNFDIKK